MLTFKNIIASKLLADTHAFVVCTHEMDALERFSKAHNGTHNDYSNSLFCPLSEDHTFICLAARILIDATGTTRLAKIPIAPDLRSKNPDEELTQAFGSNWTYLNLMMENDRNYQKNHNKGLMDVNSFGMLEPHESFQLPTCMFSSHIQILFR